MDKNTYTRKLPIIMTVITVAFLVIPSPFIYIIEAIVHLLIKDFRADLYTVRATRVGWILMIGKSVCLIFIANMSFHYERRYAQVLGDSQERYALNEGFYELLKSLFEYGALFWPLYVLNGEYTRLMQNEAIMVYIGIVMIIKCKLPTNILLEDRVYLYIKKKHILFSFYCLFIYDILTLWIGNSRTVVEPLLVNFM